jgi:hypothetical protein
MLLVPFCGHIKLERLTAVCVLATNQPRLTPVSEPLVVSLQPMVTDFIDSSGCVCLYVNQVDI